MNRRILGSAVVIASAVGIPAAAAAIHNDSSPPQSSGEQRVETMPVTDFADDRRLVGFADDVFLGRVVRQRGTAITEPLLETQFDVQVLSTVKGSLHGVVVVSQQGGVGADSDTIVVDGDSLLQVGQSYLFAARTNETTGWHTLIPHYGILPAGETQTQANLTQRFRAATAVQVPFSAEG